jgi:hypothetical protein
MKNETVPLSGSVCFIADLENEDEEDILMITGEDEAPTKIPTVKALKKTPIKEARKMSIMCYDGPITVNDIVKDLGIQEQTAKLLLTDLEKEMLWIKYGRGPTAFWKKNTR